MKKIVWHILLLFPALAAAQEGDSLRISNLKVAMDQGTMFISMDLDPSGIRLGSNREALFSPLLASGTDTLALPGIHLVGRNRYFRYLRILDDTEMKGIYRNGRQKIIRYQTIVPFEEWMGEADLLLEDSRCGCLDRLLARHERLLAPLDLTPGTFTPVFLYSRPPMKKKTRTVRGSAYIDFPVNRTAVREDYRNNRNELRKILAGIDSVRNDPDARITQLYIKGYASPDGPYAENDRLARERTRSLMDHVQGLYSFPPGTVRADHEAEDWDGLRRYVEASGLKDRPGLLAIIDGPLEPDARNWKLRSTYPEAYRHLLKECYPGLRRADYAVGYTVKAYTDVGEARRVMKLKPGNLSPYEFYMIAESYEPGSAPFNETFNIMAHIYPDDETANLNAANAAMARGDLVSAGKFLKKAGKDARADYARGLLAGLAGDYATARKYLSAARDAGIAQATEALEQIAGLTQRKL